MVGKTVMFYWKGEKVQGVVVSVRDTLGGPEAKIKFDPCTNYHIPVSKLTTVAEMQQD